MSRKVVKTVMFALVSVVFTSIGAAIAQINEMDGLHSRLTQGIFIWISVLLALIVEKIKRKDLKALGFRAVHKGAWKKVLYGIPAAAIVLAGALNGFHFQSAKYAAAVLFMTAAVGFSEEIYYRSLIFQTWKEDGMKKAVIGSAAVFGVCHLANLLGGADLIRTLLQVVFAFLYGIVFALFFALTGSVYPGVVIHFLHNTVSFLAADMSQGQEIAVVVIQTILLIAYMAYMLYAWKREINETGSNKF